MSHSHSHPLLRGLIDTAAYETWDHDGSVTTPVPSFAPSTVSQQEEEELIVEVYDRVPALIFPRISAFLSLLAVICVAVEAWKDFRADQRAYQSSTQAVGRGANRKIPTVTHIQLFFQIPLACQAIAFALGTNMAPSNDIQPYNDIWGAVGNVQTCSLQGFLVQFSMIGSVGWDMALSTCYLLMARYSYRFQTGHTRHLYLHMIIWPVALAMSLYPLGAGMYNFVAIVCWLDTYPDDCVGKDCERGEGALTWQNITSFVAIGHFVFSMGVNVILYCTIRGLESTTGNDHKNTQQRRYSRAVGTQGMLYASGIIITVLPSVVVILLYNAFGVWSEPFTNFAASMTPLMGYVNFVIFMRGRRVSECHTRYAKFLRRIHSWMFKKQWLQYVCCCCCGGWRNIICCCECSCTCEWTGFGQGSEEAPMADETASSTHRHPDQSSDFPNTTTNNTNTSGKEVASSWDKHLQRKRLSSVAEERQPQRGSSEKANITTPWKWLGYMISWGNSSNTTSQVVSDLGESVDSPEHRQYDFSPSKPKRLKSGGFQPPVLPQRASSNCSLNDDDGEDKPPSMPKRVKSYVSEITLESCLAAFDFSRTTAPTQPVRLESHVSEMTLEEIEDWHYSSHSATALAPPAKPERYLSEAESVSTCSSHQSFSHDNDGASLSSRMKTAMRLVDRAILEDEMDPDTVKKPPT